MKIFMAIVFFLLAFEFVSAKSIKKDEYKYSSTQGHIVKVVSKPGYNYSYVYDGPMMNGKPSGRGKLEVKYADGTTYRGDCEDGQRSGYGVATYSDGSVYSGYFSNDKRDGAGKLCDARGKVLQEGTWKEDRYVPDTPSAQETNADTPLETTADKIKEATAGITDLLKKISDKLTAGDSEIDTQPESVVNKLREENAKISDLLREIADKLAQRNAEIDKQPESVANKLRKENLKISKVQE
ncbi:MAG: hypothetical protein LBB29_00845 [Holosporaceae bacterium]|nr:hypothetical protein [Holosporaceae bacterium]